MSPSAEGAVKAEAKREQDDNGKVDRVEEDAVGNINIYGDVFWFIYQSNAPAPLVPSIFTISLFIILLLLLAKIALGSAFRLSVRLDLIMRIDYKKYPSLYRAVP